MSLKTIWEKQKFALILGALALGFMIATIVLGVQVSDLNSKVSSLEQSTTTTPSSGTTTDTTGTGTDNTTITGPTGPPTTGPTDAPTTGPTDAPTTAPTDAPTAAPTDAPTTVPTDASTTDTTTEASTNAPTDAPKPWDATRLPEDVFPTNYWVHLHPNIAEGSFSGCVTIKLTTTTERSWFAVHQKYLKISSTELYDSSLTPVGILTPIDYLENEYWVIQTTSTLTPGNYTLNMTFTGDLTRDIIGFYRSTYTDGDTQRQIATTKFQPTYTRQAFPCFDEPSFKASFDVELVHSTDTYKALSNMNIKQGNQDNQDNSRQKYHVRQLICVPSYSGGKKIWIPSAIESVDVSRLITVSNECHSKYVHINQEEISNFPEEGLTTTVFATSQPMVTYLACFVVSNFDHIEPRTIENLNGGSFNLTVYSAPSQVSKTELALTAGAEILKHYIEYFNIDYPLPKLDMIAIPDYISGATENWGLIAFREKNLLFDSNTGSVSNMQQVTAVVAHELAHMWFGDLVTLSWWNDLWLNEGFASFMEHKGPDMIHPDWGMMDQFLVNYLHPVLLLDATVNSHPIVQTVDNPDQITELFDSISYNKGSSVIRMLEDFMSPKSFSEGLTKFLEKYKFDNAVTPNLWEELQSSVTDQTIQVASVMDTWTRQMGYPLLQVDCNENKANCVIKQERFLSNPDASSSPDESPFGYKWDVPITYIISSNPEEIKRTWLYSSDDSVEITFEPADWLKVNHQQVGYYRVNYDEATWEALITLLQNNSQVLLTSDRANLLDDSFSVADANLLNFSVPLELSKYLIQETEYVPWNVAKTKFFNIIELLQTNENLNTLIKNHIQTLVSTIYEQIPWTFTDDTHSNRLLRSIIFDLACSVELPGCLDQAKKMFQEWIDKPDNRPHPDIREIIYYYGMAADNTNERWNQMWQLYLVETDAQERLKLLYGLSGVSDNQIIQRYLENSLDESVIRSQDFFTVLSYISGNRVGNPIAWEFYRSQWKYLSEEKFDLNNRYLGQLIRTITQYFGDEDRHQEMIDFFTQFPEAGAGTQARQQALENVETNIKWIVKHQSTLETWFSSQ